jgi:hypothetical protein
MFRSRSKHGMIYYENSIRPTLTYTRERQEVSLAAGFELLILEIDNTSEIDQASRTA